jgi:hypothetical protein
MKRELTNDQLECYETDLILTNSSCEESINSIIGTYNRMTYFEQSRGEAMISKRLEQYLDIKRKYRDLKAQLPFKTLPEKIEYIQKLHIELYDVLELEKLIYSNEKGID